MRATRRAFAFIALAALLLACNERLPSGAAMAAQGVLQAR